MTASSNIRRALISEIPEVELSSFDEGSIVSFVSRTDLANPINVIALADVMKEQFKWYLVKTQYPKGLHLEVTLRNANVWRKFVDDVR